jgi:DNA-binding transcriptional regulator YdaS (Cro superfamily)
MKLHIWLAESNKSAAWLAQETGLSAPYICRLIAGARVPSIDTCVKIAKATDGAVTVVDFIPEPEPKRKRPSQREVSRAA